MHLGKCRHFNLRALRSRPLLRGYHDDAVCRPRSPNAGCRRVLQNGHALHIIRVNAAELTLNRETVHHHQRTGIRIQRGLPTDFKTDVPVLISRTLHTGSHAHQPRCQAGCRLIQLGTRHHVERTRCPLLGNRLVTGHQHLIQRLRVALQHHIQSRMRANLHFLALHPHERELQHDLRVIIHPQLKAPVHIRCHAHLRALHQDRNTRHRLAVAILHRPAYRPFVCLRHKRLWLLLQDDHHFIPVINGITFLPQDLF